MPRNAVIHHPTPNEPRIAHKPNPATKQRSKTHCVMRSKTYGYDDDAVALRYNFVLWICRRVKISRWQLTTTTRRATD